MSDWNSSLDTQNSSPDWNPESVQIDALTTPESIQERYGVSKSTYYYDIKFLKAQGYEIYSHKDGEGCTILEPETVQLVCALREHVAATGNREGFRYGGELLVSDEETSLSDVMGDVAAQMPGVESASGSQLDEMVRQAQELAAHNFVIGNQVVAEMARQIGYGDLPEDLQQRVDQARAAALPKVDPAEVASSLLNRWRASQGSGHPSGTAA
ncbi:hypothetical protein C7271_15860 [filamentous cyanobacterium CCP5]|nr:hypothetical protein C7271_15860 [filamentous cyanobacterium CCP5]